MEQSDWRFCTKCDAMFFDGFPGKGVCAGGGGHTAAGFMFVLPHSVGETPNAQGAWRFCQKCNVMFFDGSPQKGACAAGGGHEAAGFTFVLPHDVPESSVAQAAWRFCGRCNTMFFDGFASKGACPAGGGHAAAGFMFVLPHVDDDVLTFDTGPITSDLALGGSAHLVVTRSGDFTFSTHAHDSGFDDIDYALGAALATPSGLVFTFQHEGHVEGTSSGLPFGTPDRDDDFVDTANNAMLAGEFDRLRGAVLAGRLTGRDALVGGIEDLIGQAVSQAEQELGAAAGAAAGAAVVALV